MYFSPSFTDLRIVPGQIYRAMGYRRTKPDDYTTEMTLSLMEEAECRIRPRIYVKIAKGEIRGDILQIENTVFHPGNTILRQFGAAEQYQLFLETAGKEYETWQNETALMNDLLRQYLLDALGSCVIEGCTRYLLYKITQQIPRGWGKTLPFSPGHCEWETREQRQLFSLFPSDEIPVTLTDSCLMLPVKSASGIVGTGKNIGKMPSPCRICTKTDCFRRIS